MGINGENDAEMKELWSIVAGSDDAKIVEKTKEKTAKTKEKTEKTKEKAEKTPKKSAKRKREPEIVATAKTLVEETAEIVEKLMAIFELAWENDVVSNTESKPCLEKLRKLPLLIDALSRKNRRPAFIDRGVFSLLKNWLEPMPDGSLPNVNIRQAILTILTDQFRINFDDDVVKQQLKRSSLGKCIMFLSLSEEETQSNRKLARDLVYRWSRGLYNISTRFEDARPIKDEHKRPCLAKPTKEDPVVEPEKDPIKVEVYRFKSGVKKVGKSDTRLRVQIPESTSTTFVVAPPNRPRKMRPKPNERHMSVMKTIKKLGRIRRPLQEVRAINKMRTA